MQTILEINDVKKNFGKEAILKGISLSVKEGEIISVLGPSGCGKSTLLNIIAGILPLDAGSVTIRGKQVSGEKGMVPTEMRDINMVFQDFALCNLDIQLRIEMRTEMAQLFHSLKTTVFHVTHDPSEAGSQSTARRPVMCGLVRASWKGFALLQAARRVTRVSRMARAR